MSIIFHENTKEFHLTNGQVSYIMEIMENGQIGQLYYGKALRDRDSFQHLHEEKMRSLMAVALPEPSSLSMDAGSDDSAEKWKQNLQFHVSVP